MSVALKLSSLDAQTKSEIMKLKVVPKKTQFVTDPKPIFTLCVNKNDDSVYVPIFKYKDFLEEFPIKKYPKINITPSFNLLTIETDPLGRKRDQDIVIKKALKKLKKHHSVFIASFTGFGKSKCGIYLLCKLGYKAIILCHNNVIKEQWKDELLDSVNENIKIQIISGNKGFDPTADVYIIGILKAKTLKRSDVKHIGTVIIDEAHICTVTAFTQSLLKFQPMYLIGLSATPERSDGLQSLLNVYFGPSKKFIVREEVKNFTVIKYKTQYVPEVSYQYFQGNTTLAWTDMMTSLSEIEERWKEIANIVLNYKTQKIILICDRTKMAENIFDYLTEKGEDVVLFIGSTKTWDKTKRVLITSVKKGGVGLNDPSLNMLILAADMRNVKQCEGRIRTTDNIVVDVVDDYSTLENHWIIREKWYIKRGATIESNQKISEVPEQTRFLPPLV